MHTRSHPSTHQKLGVWIIILVLGMILFTTIKSILAKNSGIISPLPLENTQPSVKNKIKDPQELIQKITELTSKQQGIYSIYIYDLNKNPGYGINETTIFTAASVNKIPILAALYFEAQKDNIDLDKRITLQASDIQDYGTGSLRYEGPGGVYSLKTLAQLMIEKSDNTAAFVLTSVVGGSRIQELATSWGLTQTDIRNNKTSPKDMTLLLSKMYKRQITSEALTTEMIGFMDDSDFEDRLPALLPKDVKVYHKIGNEVGNIHDVGIIALPNKPYYIGVLSNDVTNDTQVEEAIAKVSKMVFDYMSQ